MAGPIHLSARYSASNPQIHFSPTFPATAASTKCGGDGPASPRWGIVTCFECLRLAPKDPRIEARLAALLAEEEERFK